MKCMKNKRLETYQEMKNLEKACKITKEEVWSERERGLGLHENSHAYFTICIVSVIK